LEHPTLIEPGKVYKYDISLWETSNVFKAGHRIRIDISSSNFPRYARNQNTGNSSGMSAEIKIAHQTIYPSAQFPSHLVLPVIPIPWQTSLTFCAFIGSKKSPFVSTRLSDDAYDAAGCPRRTEDKLSYVPDELDP
jgi:hypothetical protein